MLQEPTKFISDEEEGGFPQEINQRGCIQLIECDGNCPKVRKEVYIPYSSDNIIAFSPNGQHLVLFRREAHTIDIHLVET
jgi:hypothetical protein